MPGDRPQLSALTFGDLLTSLGDKTPTPGGGAAASITLALAAHLGRMVVNYSKGKKSLAVHAETHDRALATLRQFGDRALDLAEEDAAAYGRLNTLWKLDPEDEERVANWDDAVAAAIAAPKSVLEECVALADLLHELLPASNRHLLSDLAIAAILTEAAARAAAWNVAVNLPLVGDSDRAGVIAEAADRAVAMVRESTARVERACRA